MRNLRWTALLLASVVSAGCGSAKPITIADPAKPPSALAEWVGQHRVLRQFGDRAEVSLKATEKRSGTCDVAVDVAAVDPVPAGIRLVLTSIGRLRIGEGSTIGTCKVLVPRITLTAQSDDAALRAILMTADEYLAANGRTLDFPPAGEPKVVADKSLITDEETRRLTRRVTAWPRPVLAVEPAYSSGGKVRHEGELEFEMVVGADGRALHPKVKTSLDDAHKERGIAALALWRFEPARADGVPVAARYEGHTVLRIY